MILTIKELKEGEKKLRKVTDYKKPKHSFTYNELHQRVIGSLEQTKEIREMIEEEINLHSQHTDVEGCKMIITELNHILGKLNGNTKHS